MTAIVIGGAVVALVIFLAWRVSQMGQGGSRAALPEGVPVTVESLVAARRKIDAIKLLREETGLGLKEAKEAVEAFEAGRPLPPRHRSAPENRA